MIDSKQDYILENTINSDEITSLEEEIQEENFSFIEGLNMGLYALFATSGSILENTAQPYMNHLYEQGFLSKYNEHILKHFLSHIGDVTNGFLVCSAALIGDEILNKLNPNERSKILTEARKIFPFLIVTIMFAWIIDAETSQNFILSMGAADVKDIPAGLFGLLAGAVYFEKIKKNKQCNT